jgi:hypothetical protein
MTKYTTASMSKRSLEGQDFDLLPTLPFKFAEDEFGICANLFERYMQLVFNSRAIYTVDEIERVRFVWNGQRNVRTVFLVKTHTWDLPRSRPSSKAANKVVPLRAKAPVKSKKRAAKEPLSV